MAQVTIEATISASDTSTSVTTAAIAVAATEQLLVVTVVDDQSSGKEVGTVTYDVSSCRMTAAHARA